jgi:serine/threonine protein kinase
MPKDTLVVGTPPNSSHFQPQKEFSRKCEQIELTKLIGRGTFSQVYLSHDVETGELMAVKVMDLRRFEEEYNSEVNIMTTLSQRGVNVQYISSEIDGGNDTGYIYLKYVPYPTLSEYLEKLTYGMKEQQAMLVLYNLVRVVEEIHSCGIAHKDLKPENIFVDPSSFRVCVIDFGLSSVIDGRGDKKFCGSPLYMAPEMLQKEPYDPVQSDIWSIGVILYEMLLGNNPWSHAENLEDLIDLLYRIEFPAFLTKSSVALLSGVLRMEPEKRLSLHQIKITIHSILDK